MKAKLIACMAALICSLPVQGSSLFSESTFRPMVSDSLARHVGDSVTVLIVETSRAKSSSGDKQDASLNASANLSLTNRTEKGSLGLGYDLAGNDVTNRAGDLKAMITADILSIDDRGRFYVSGQQIISVNGQEQFITVSGWIRPDHIDAYNRIVSSRLSQAKIEYAGFEPEDKGIMDTILGWFSSDSESPSPRISQASHPVSSVSAGVSQ